MNQFLKISVPIILTVWSFPLTNSAQDLEKSNPPKIFEPSRDFTASSDSGPSNLLNLFTKPEHDSIEESENISELTVENNSASDLESKNMVRVPERNLKKILDAADFNDPFYRVRGFQEESEKVLQPGTTVDGVQFQSYGDSEKFTERFYRDSRFSIDKVYNKIKYLEKRGGCYTCHQGIEEISSNHKMACVKCHGGNRRAKSLPRAHKGLVANPSSVENAPRFCGKCHKSHVNKIGRSVMATAKRMINVTRFSWGAQTVDEMPYSLFPGEKEQPYPSSTGNGHAVDSFLKTKCLRCHLDAPSPHRSGEFRATGCSACHMLYTNSGVSLSHDRAIQSIQKKDKKQKRFERKFSNNSMSNRRGYPLLHKFTIAIPSTQCEHCHNNNGVGNEFEGLYAKPDRPINTLKSINDEKPVLYGKEHEFLVPDIHREKGMHCIDCHIGDEMKPESEPDGLRSAVQIRCIDCHGTPSEKPEGFKLIDSDPGTKQLLKKINMNPNLKRRIRVGDTVLMNSGSSPMMHIKMEKGKWKLYSKVSGKKFTIPLLKNIEPAISHQIPKHMMEIECAACHARWAASEWGMHLIREKSLTPKKWGDWNISDPDLQEQLLHTTTEGMIDWLSAESNPERIEGDRLPGYWFSVFSESGWSNMILGKNERGKYSIIKPRYQYFISDKTTSSLQKRVETPLTVEQKPGLVWSAYSPHTIRKTARSCESCHQNALNAGLGDPLKENIQDADSFLGTLQSKNTIPLQFQLKQGVTENGDSIQTFYPNNGSRFLNKEEISNLKDSTNRYRALRFLNLRELSFPRLLSRQEFPYDTRHHAQENTIGTLPARKDLFYDVKENQLLEGDVSSNSLSYDKTTPPSSVSENSEEPANQEPIIEFLYDIFQKDDLQSKKPQNHILNHE